MQQRSSEIEQLIVQVYSEEDYAKYMPLLRQFGFDTREQEVLQYEEGFFTKMWYGVKELF